MQISNSFRLGIPEVFPAVERHVYLDAASVGLSHKGNAKAISRWHELLMEEGAIAFDEQAETVCLDNLKEAMARLVKAAGDDLAIASSETVLMQSLAWAVMPEKGSTLTIKLWARLSSVGRAESG